MGISLNSRILAEPRFEGVHGLSVAGGYVLRLSVGFNVLNWEGPNPPIVVFGATPVHLHHVGGLLLGIALPEVAQPFRIGSYGQTSRLLFDLQLTPLAMETLERLRDGQGVRLTLKLRPEIRTATELDAGFEDLQGHISIADWLAALEQAGYGRSMLFEVPLPEEVPGLEIVVDRMEAARKHFVQGHYSDVVAACRLALEALTQALGQQAAMTAALQQHKASKLQLDLAQRELVMRQALTDFSSLAHHVTGVPLEDLFDRTSAQLALGSAAALISSALGRRAAAPHIP